jgi:xanthine dehydrogenase accessory factor
MKEISDILKAYTVAKAAGKKAALATVVKVEGSSYRQPGARMLVTEDGELTGAISGGCLEGDALKKALLAIHQQKNKLITYDTSNEDDIEFGVQLGCNGIVYILFEYIDDTDENNPVLLLQKLEEKRQDAAVTVLFSRNRQAVQPGTVLFFRSAEDYQSAGTKMLLQDAKEALVNKASVIINIEVDGFPCDALVEYIPVPLALIIAGAGNDVKPLAAMALMLGWHVTIADGRATHATSRRFPDVDRVLLAKPEELMEQVKVDERTCFVLMTHNYNYDLALLKLLLDTDCPYIGTLGPKTKLQRMLNDLHNEGIIITEEQLNRIYGPVGLDIGAETSEEIAVSITAEINAVMSSKSGASLKYKQEKIHAATQAVL